MSFETGLFTDLSDTNSIADPVVLVAAEAVKLSPFLGSFWNSMPLFTEPTSNRKFDIYSRSETQRAGTIGAVGWIDGVALSFAGECVLRSIQARRAHLYFGFMVLGS